MHGLLLGAPGRSWASLGHLLAALEALLGTLEALLARSRAALRRSCGALGTLLAASWHSWALFLGFNRARGPWEALWTPFWGSLASLGHSLASLGDFAGLLEPHPSLLGHSLAIFIAFLVLRSRILSIFRCFWCPPVFLCAKRSS